MWPVYKKEYWSLESVQMSNPLILHKKERIVNKLLKQVKNTKPPTRPPPPPPTADVAADRFYQ